MIALISIYCAISQYIDYGNRPTHACSPPVWMSCKRIISSPLGCVLERPVSRFPLLEKSFSSLFTVVDGEELAIVDSIKTHSHHSDSFGEAFDLVRCLRVVSIVAKVARVAGWCRWITEATGGVLHELVSGSYVFWGIDWFYGTKLVDITVSPTRLSKTGLI